MLAEAEADLICNKAVWAELVVEVMLPILEAELQQIHQLTQEVAAQAQVLILPPMVVAVLSW
jgi:hypothetical protein